METPFLKEVRTTEDRETCQVALRITLEQRLQEEVGGRTAE